MSMSFNKDKYFAVEIPTPGTFCLVPNSEFDQISVELECTSYLVLPKREELTFAFLLKHHREAKNLSQQDLEALSGVGQKHISNIEKGITIPRIHTLEKLFTYLDPRFEAGVKYLLSRKNTAA